RSEWCHLREQSAGGPRRPSHLLLITLSDLLPYIGLFLPMLGAGAPFRGGGCMSTSRRPVLRIAAAVASLAVLVAVLLILRNREEPEGPGTRDRRGMPGFHEEAQEAGISFRMTVLPAEQGEDFRANLYDHGCGVAIAD